MNRLLKTFISIICIIYGNLIWAQGGNPFGTNPYSKNPIQNPFGNGDGGNKKNDKKTDNKKEASKADQLEAAKENVKNKNNKNTDKDQVDIKDKSKNEEDDESNSNEDGELVNKKETKGVSNISSENDTYGMSFFTDLNEGKGFSNNSDIVTPPAGYKIGPGDEIIVNIWGPSEVQESYDVGKDGSIYPGRVGRINLLGISFENAKRVISSRFKSIIANGSSIDVQMGKIRTIKVTLIGEVKKNGTITTTAFTTVINALAYAGGITELGNLRKIELKRNGYTVTTIDLYEFIKTGGSLDDQFLEDGDVINVGTYDKKVKAEGSFKRPMYYQLTENENLNNLIDLAGGPTFDARYSSVQLKSVVNEVPKLITVNLKDLNSANTSLAVFDGDVVTIKKINPNFNNTIEIDGSVNYPDIYEVQQGDKLLTVIEKAGGLISDAFTSRAYIYRGDTNMVAEVAKIDLNALISGDLSQNMEILPGDRINIISKKSFIKSYYVEITGSINKPLKMEYSKNLTVKDLLIASGGITSDAENGRIEIASIIDSADNYSLYLKGERSWRSITINPNLEIDNESENTILKPYDKVYVRKKDKFKLLEKVYIFGEVKYPGEYPLINGNEKITDIINYAGGVVNETAYLKGAYYFRKGFGRVSMDFEYSINNPKSIYNLNMKDGDSIYVPRANELVTITGQVQKQVSVLANSNITDIAYYISAAGGYSEDPWRKRISVTYPNGQIKTTKSVLFVNIYPKVEPGSIISVPKKPEPKDNRIKWTELATASGYILTTFSTLVTTYFLIYPPKP
jgi:polysaccharide biosynthesis/export protein